MATVLPFRAKEARPSSPTKNDPAPNHRRRQFALAAPLQVVTITLETGERLPMLVDADTWIPRSLAMRWVLYDRRYTCAESTLRGDVSALRFVYAWGDAAFRGGLDARLTLGPLDHGELLALRAFLTNPPAGDSTSGDEVDVERATGAAGSRGLAAKLFLMWAITPASRNDVGAPPANAAELAAMIHGVLQPLAKHAGKGRSRVVPPEDLIDAAEEIIRPLLGPDGGFLRPLQWHPANPFRADTRLRNWLMWTFARDSGLRLGEILSLPTNATHQTAEGAYILVRTDADRSDDPRARSPQAKTVSRAVPLSPHGKVALTAYLTSHGRGRRVRGNAYLVSAVTGAPLSHNPADQIMRHLSSACGTPVTWHDLRHTWATEYARSVYRAVREGNYPSTGESTAMMALLTEQLKALGGWSATSEEPAYYARAAIKEEADRMLRGIQDARAQRMAAQRAADSSAVLSNPVEFVW